MATPSVSIVDRCPVLALFDAFVRYMREEMQFSPLTLHAYLVDLMSYAEWLAKRAGGKIVSDEQEVFEALQARARNAREEIPANSLTGRIVGIDAATLSAYFEELDALGELQGSSINRRIASTRAFYKWATKRHLVALNPSLTLKARRTPPPQPQRFSNEMLERLLGGVKGAPLTALRDRAIVLILHDLGLRSGEIVALNQVDLKGDLLSFGGKRSQPSNPASVLTGRRARSRRLSQRAATALAEYLALPSVGKSPGQPLFVNKDGGRLSCRSLRRQFDKYLRTAGLSPALSPLDLRTSCIVNDLLDVQDRQRVNDLHGLLSAGNLSRLSKLVADAQRERQDPPVRPVVELKPLPPKPAVMAPVLPAPGLGGDPAPPPRKASPFGRATVITPSGSGDAVSQSASHAF